MPRGFFVEHYLPLLNALIDDVKTLQAPVIFFGRHAHHLLEDFKALHADILSVDELRPLTEVDRLTQEKFSRQGNLDPLVLFSSEAVVRREKTRELVKTARALGRPCDFKSGPWALASNAARKCAGLF